MPTPDHQPTFVDLFAGAGGLTSGLESAGFRLALGVDADPPAASTFAMNFGASRAVVADVRGLTPLDIPRVDLIVAGLPSSGYSRLERLRPGRSTDEPTPASDKSLWREAVRLISGVRPSIFMLDNVPSFGASPAMRFLLDECESGSLKGYALSWKVLQAADFGVPQTRQRVVIIGSRIGPIEFPVPSHSKTGASSWRTVRDAIGDLALVPSADSLPRRTASPLGFSVPGAYSALELHFSTRHKADSIARYDHVPPGGSRFNIPADLLSPCWRRRTDGWTDVMGRLVWDAPSVTIRTSFTKPEKGRYLHPEWDPLEPRRRVNRSLTHLEAARLQGFPDDFLWCGSRVAIAEQIGNAMPPPLGAALGLALMSAIRETRQTREARVLQPPLPT
jgi:DNA (cytosine-5)-methyltransferase 1